MSQYLPRTLSLNIRTPFNLPGRLRLSFSGPGRTKQSFKAECDINVIMRRYQQTGVIDNLNRGEPRYLDTTGFDYQQAMMTVANARSLFEELPARQRARFDNDPQRLLEFASDPANLAESIEMGLVDPARLSPALAATLPPGTPGAPAAGAPGPVSGESGNQSAPNKAA